MYQEILKRVEEYSKEKGILRENTGIVIGLSGGADSVFLTWVLGNLRQKWRLKLCAVHVNHGIRGEEAVRDERFSEKYAAWLEIPFYSFEEDIPALAAARHMSEEEAGRDFRYQCFEQVRNRLGYDMIAVAHHREDQAETILFQMLRGCGLRGLGGMRAVRDKIVRPLLCVGKEEILQGLDENGLEFCVDSTNEETRYRRNKIRKEMLPLLQQIQEGAVAHLVRLGEEMQQVTDYLQVLTEDCYQRIVQKQEGYLQVRERDFLSLPYVLQRELIMRMLEEMAGQRKDMGFVHVEQLQKLFAGGTGKRLDLPYGLQGWKEYQSFCLGKRKSEERGKLPGELRLHEQILFTDSQGEQWMIYGEIKPRELVSEINLKKNCTKCFDYDRMDTMPRFRYWEEGDYLCLGREGQRKKLSRIFVDEKLPQQCRRRITVLAEGSHVLWIPELGRQSAYFYVSEQTRRVLCLERLIQ